MPVMGPDLSWARKKGEEIGRELLAKLIEEHKLLDITSPKFVNFGTFPGAKERWDETKAKFIAAVAELFIEDCANGW